MPVIHDDDAIIKRFRLTAGQKRILLCLSKAVGVLHAETIERRANVHKNRVAMYLYGRRDPEKSREAQLKLKIYPLTDRGYISMRTLDIDGKAELVFEITEEGRKALAMVSHTIRR